MQIQLIKHNLNELWNIFKSKKEIASTKNKKKKQQMICK